MPVNHQALETRLLECLRADGASEEYIQGFKAGWNTFYERIRAWGPGLHEAACQCDLCRAAWMVVSVVQGEKLPVEQKFPRRKLMEEFVAVGEREPM